MAAGSDIDRRRLSAIDHLERLEIRRVHVNAGEAESIHRRESGPGVDAPHVRASFDLLSGVVACDDAVDSRHLIAGRPRALLAVVDAEKHHVDRDDVPLAKVSLLILDDWGLQGFSAEGRRDLLEIVEQRYGRNSIAIASQIPVERWPRIIGEATIADAVLDRIVHNAYRIELTGESQRKRNKPPPLDGGDPEPTKR